MNNSQYADILDSIATLRKIRGDSPFKSRAFENAARSIRKLPNEIEELIDEGFNLVKLDGIGKSISAELLKIHATGASPTRAELLAEFPDGILELTRVEGLGPKRIKLLYDTLGIANLGALEEAAKNGQIAELPGLGTKLEIKIIAEIERLKHTSIDRVPMPMARVAGESIVRALKELECIEKIEIAGSIRRGRETSKDIDILVASEDHERVFDAFVGLKEIDNVLVRGKTKTSTRLKSGIQVDVRVVKKFQFGAALHYFTGSKAHNIQMRTRAKKMGLRINEYGVLRLEDEKYIASEQEEDIFAAVGLPWIPAELREGNSEIEDALENRLPDLIDAKTICGDLHMHTTDSDGANTIMDMVSKARELGYSYIAITDHSPFAPVAEGMNAARFEAQIALIQKLNTQWSDFKILAGIEVDILKDGSLDMDADLLRECDWVVGSVHTSMKMPLAEMTERLLLALETCLLSSLGHPTGRILGGRKGYEYDFEKVVESAIENRCAFEINGSTSRLDFNADLAKRAYSAGAMFVLSSDAHSTRGLEDMRFGIQQSRRAGIPKERILNSLRVKGLLAATRRLK